MIFQATFTACPQKITSGSALSCSTSTPSSPGRFGYLAGSEWVGLHGLLVPPYPLSLPNAACLSTPFVCSENSSFFYSPLLFSAKASLLLLHNLVARMKPLAQWRWIHCSIGLPLPVPWVQADILTRTNSTQSGRCLIKDLRCVKYRSVCISFIYFIPALNTQHYLRCFD